MVGLPVGGAAVQTGLCVHLVDQDVAASAGLDDGVARRGVARDHDRAVGGVEAEAEGVRPGAVRHREGGHRHVLVPVDLARLDLVRIHLDPGHVLRLASVEADVDVLGVGGEEVLGHRPGPGWSVDLQRLVSIEHPRREDEVGAFTTVDG